MSLFRLVRRWQLPDTITGIDPAVWYDGCLIFHRRDVSSSVLDFGIASRDKQLLLCVEPAILGERTLFNSIKLVIE